MSGLDRAAPREKGLGAGGLAFGFVLAIAGGVAIYSVEGWLVFTGALPSVVVWLTIWGYGVWVLVTARSFYQSYGRGKRGPP